MHKKRKIGLIIILIFILSLLSSYYLLISWLPGSLSIVKNSESTLDLHFPFHLYIKGQKDSNLIINGKKIGNKFLRVNTEAPLKFKGGKIGQSSLNFKLFGLIPIRTIKVNILPEVRVFPGGQAIGVLLRSKGVMVVGNSFVKNKAGEKCHPAQEAGIEVGDVILKIGDKQVNDKVALSSLIQEFAKKNTSISIKIKKKRGNIKTVRVKPVKNKQGTYMIGLFVDDGVAGVGTLTFYNPQTREYGALGHVITESSSQIKIDVREGQIVEAQISGINYGRKGIPGEKQGTFFQANNILGKIKQNTKFGIYGILQKNPVNPYFKKAIPVAAISQVKTGPAQIYTVVKGNEIKEYDINIDRVYHQSFPNSKGMIISITDSELKRLTGGIIQGMSGSPIVQDGKLVGAVTHVFVNNPAKGYGVFAEWMLLQTGSFKNKDDVVNY